MKGVDDGRLLIFLHIGKAGGSTLYKILEKQYEGVECFFTQGGPEDKDDERVAALTGKQKEDIRMVRGHVNYGVHERFGRPPVYFTMLREPVDRIVSYYYFLQKAVGHYYYDRCMREKWTLEDFMHNAIDVDNGQTRALAGVMSSFSFARKDAFVPFGKCDEEILETAKKNLAGFAAVGLTERFDESIILFKRLLGWPSPPLYTKQNVTHVRPRMDEVSEGALELIREHNRLDIELYSYAQDLFEKQLDEQDGSYGVELEYFRLLNAAHQKGERYRKEHEELELRYQTLKKEYDLLADSRSVRLTKKLSEHPLLRKIAVTGHDLFEKAGTNLSNSKATTRWLNVEFASKCVLRCKWCSLDHSRPPVYLEKDILEKLLDEVTDSGHFDIERIDLHNGGETLLHPRIGEMLSVIADRRSAHASFPRVNLLTNAVLLDHRMSETLLRSGALDLVRFSVDGGSPGAFEEIRRGAKWSKVRDNIKRFISLNGLEGRRVETGIICIVPPGRPAETGWMDSEFRELLQAVDGYELRPPHNWDGSRDLSLGPDVSGQQDGARKGSVCKFLTNNLVVLPDASVTVCCADLNGRGVVGSLKHDTLFGIYNSKRRKDVILLYANGRKNEIELCRRCSGYY